MKNYTSLAVLVAILSLLATAPQSVLAHADYVSSTPAAEASLTTAPSSVSVVFSEEVTRDSELVVVDAAGKGVDQGDSKLDTADAARKTVVVSLKSGLGNGVYTVNWTSASTDGHSEEGSFKFSVGAATAPGQLPTTSAADGQPFGALLVLAGLLAGVGLMLRRRASL